jgi:hypothetical protein
MLWDPSLVFFTERERERGRDILLRRRVEGESEGVRNASFSFGSIAFGRHKCGLLLCGDQ